MKIPPMWVKVENNEYVMYVSDIHMMKVTSEERSSPLSFQIRAGVNIRDAPWKGGIQVAPCYVTALGALYKTYSTRCNFLVLQSQDPPGGSRFQPVSGTHSLGILAKACVQK